MPGGRPPQDEKTRFLAKVKAMPGGCHEWQAQLHRDGYGKFSFRGKTVQSHRAGYTLLVGEIPAGRWVLHRCDNRLCVNPAHLFLGDAIANIRDMDEKGRRGIKSRLTEMDVDRIKHLLSTGVSQQQVGDAFGICQSAVSKIKLGKSTRFLKE